ncbi:MAG: helix-turn-helix transcriptional regulator [Candidatus Eremiobacterota bacterium]
MRTWKEVKKDLLKAPEFAREVENLRPEYELISQIIQLRIEQNVTQEELAKRTGIKQSNISRLESGSYNPSLQFLKKIAKGLGKDLSISFK